MAQVGIESVKTAADVYMPVAGEVTESNSSLSGAPEKLSEEPEGEGWLIKVKFSDAQPLGDLLDQAAYEKFLKESGDQH